MSTTHRRHFTILVVLFGALWLALAIKPNDRKDWLLENVLVFAAVGLFFASRRHFVFSRLSYTLIFVFLCLHVVGAHYTYAEVPYDNWFRSLTGHSFNEVVGWKRNNFDRVVHFLYGLLLAYPIREVFLRVVNVRGFWGYFLPLDFTMSTSMLYELIEWGVAVTFGGGLGVAYLSAQGDVWDSQEDMAMASLGAVISMTVTALINARLQRDFAREWADSFRVKQPEPLGEEALARMMNERKPREGR